MKKIVPLVCAIIVKIYILYLCLQAWDIDIYNFLVNVNQSLFHVGQDGYINIQLYDPLFPFS